MMSLEAIRQFQDEAAERAAQKGLYPYVPLNRAEVEQYGVSRNFPFPNIGTYEPEGWKQVDWKSVYDGNGAWFVDKSGLGADDEPAFSVRRFRESLIEYRDAHPEHGYAIVEEGQFQLTIAAFEPIDKPASTATAPRRRGDGWTM